MTYLGCLDHADLARLVGDSSVLLQTPGWDEPYCLAAAEAIACGTPVAAFARGGLSEVIDEDSGLLVEPDSVEALARAALRVREMPRERVRAHARASLSLERTGAAYETLYRRLAGRENPSVIKDLDEAISLDGVRIGGTSITMGAADLHRAPERAAATDERDRFVACSARRLRRGRLDRAPRLGRPLVATSAARSADARGLLHWAPLSSTGYTERMAGVAAWIAATRPDAVVVDVSVEMALLVRLMGVRPIWVAQRGVRDDPPHQLAYTAAQTIIAPWTEATQVPDAPGAPPRERTTLVGALSRFDDLPAPPAAGRPSVCVLLGFGGHGITAADIAAAARATPAWRWDVTGVPAGASAPNVCVHPPGCDVWALLARATVAVATASSNAVSEVAAARRPLICLPQRRPFAEQHDQAATLQRAGLATVLEQWPAAERWPALLDAAARRDPSSGGCCTTAAARRASPARSRPARAISGRNPAVRATRASRASGRPGPRTGRRRPLPGRLDGRGAARASGRRGDKPARP